ncbi:NYN domain-containing protein [Nocardioides eburneiflavus]|nr:NYN domain-containing protein [Nocardioides eburneiflavus]
MIAAEREPEFDNEDELTVLVRRWIARPPPDNMDRTRNAAATSTPGVRRPTSLPTRRSQLLEPCGHSELARLGRHASGAAETPVRSTEDPPEVPQLLASPPEPTQRLALLVEARATPPETADGLIDVLAGMGSVTVRRGYADWTQPDMGAWLGLLRRHGIQPVHHFCEEGAELDSEQALVSMSVDAVDLARSSAVDTVVIVGNPGSMVPLVTRLQGSGVRVVAVGPESTPYGVRARSDDFIDFARLAVRPAESTRAGRHRA